ncbi:MAG: methyltransferase domain-containing protein [Boseongicola sp.]|nr:MAG: methyltransferase domain-containing protein [Boseongicola sp.]
MDDPTVSPLFADPNLAAFYDSAQTSRHDFDYCRDLASNARSVLDLGCGTGAFACSIADTRRVVGVEPASGMLDIARQRPSADKVTWHQGSAETMRLDETFDLIVLTGHTFQVFLTRDQQLNCLHTIRAHLSENGTFIFDTRNPEYPGSKERSKSQTLSTGHHPELGAFEKWNSSKYDEESGILTYTNGYRILKTGNTHAAEARIRYSSLSEISDLMKDAGLSVQQWLGDWQGGPFTQNSPEIIPVGHIAT